MAQLDEAVVEGALTCFECLYDLRGLPLQGRCPECGVDIVASLRPDRWDHANPGWRSRVMLGLIIAPVEYAWLVGSFLASAFLHFNGSLALLIVYGGMATWAVLSGWLIASSEPRPDASGRRWRLSTLVFSALTGLAYATLISAFQWGEDATIRSVPLLLIVVVGLTVINGAKQGVQLAYVAVQLARVAGHPLRRVAWPAAAAPAVAWWAVISASLLAMFRVTPPVLMSAVALVALGLFALTVVYEIAAFLALRRGAP